MNPVVLGALIAAVPTLAAASLATWATTRASRASRAADHARWLRDKRSELYVDVIRRVEAGTNSRALGIAGATVALSGELPDPAVFASEQAADLMARVTALASNHVISAFLKVLDADSEVSEAIAAEVTAALDAGLNPDSQVPVRGRLADAAHGLAEARSDLEDAIRLDLTTPYGG